MSERLRKRLARISTEAECMANIVASERNKFDRAGPFHVWDRWDRLYRMIEGIMSDANVAGEILRGYPDMDLEI